MSTEHLVVGLSADRALQLPGRDALVAAFATVRGGSQRVTSADPESAYQALEKYSVDLTQAARDGSWTR